MRKWHRLFPAVLTLGLLTLAAVELPTLLAQQSPTPLAPKPRASFPALTLPPTLPVATGYTTVDAFATKSLPAGLSFSQPLEVVAYPGDPDRVIVAEKTGKIFSISNRAADKTPEKSLFFDFVAYLQTKNYRLDTRVETGVLGVAFHPKFAENHYVFITYSPMIPEPTGPSKSYDRLARFTVNTATNPPTIDPASELPLITQFDEAPNHNGGCVRFGDDGYLYYMVGDEGNANDFFDNARWIDKDFFAALYRLDVDNKPESLAPNPHAQNSLAVPSAVNPGAYKIPADNPFIGITSYFGKQVDPKKVRTEIHSNGWRNPWRFSFDSATGRLWVADVGQEKWEEINIAVKGGNYGWSYRESLHDGVRAASTPPEAKFNDPIYEYTHDNVGNFSGKSISGGFVYRGTQFAELTGAYIFGDYVSKRVWALRDVNGKWTPSLLAANVGNVGFYPDPVNGDILIADLAGSRIRRLVRTGVQGSPPPALLSQTGAFKDLKSLTPADGLLAYAPNVSFWSDYAIKSRFFSIPNASDTITFNPTGNWAFPTGTVWVKHFEMEMTRGDASTRRRLETRFLVKTPGEGTVYGITYKWRPDGSDADLVPEGGMDETLTITENGKPRPQIYHYPSQSECLTCHTPQSGGALSFNTPQMNGPASPGGPNQLLALSSMGYFSAPIPDVKTLPAYAKSTDTSATLDWRVRSYLAVNCVQCHQPGGVAQGLFDARFTTPTATAGLVNGPLMNDKGDKANRVMIPKDLNHSMILKRVQAQDKTRMPPLSSNENDPTAQKLLTEWIQQNP